VYKTRMVIRSALFPLLGSAGGLLTGLGGTLLLHGHRWASLLLAAGLLMTAWYYIRTGRDWRRRRKERFRA